MSLSALGLVKELNMKDLEIRSFNFIIFNILTLSFNLDNSSAFSNYYTYNDRILLTTKHIKF